LNDPTTTFPHTPFTTTERLVVTDSDSNSAYHLALFILAGGVFVFTRHRYGLAVGIYVAAIICLFLAFCGYLRLQPWHSRFHMTFYALLMPFVAVVLTQGLTRLVYPIVSAFLALGLYSFLANGSRAPFAAWFDQDHEAKYFVSAPDWRKSFAAAAETVI